MPTPSVLEDEVFTTRSPRKSLLGTWHTHFTFDRVILHAFTCFDKGRWDGNCFWTVINIKYVHPRVSDMSKDTLCYYEPWLWRGHHTWLDQGSLEALQHLLMKVTISLRVLCSLPNGWLMEAEVDLLEGSWVALALPRGLRNDPISVGLQKSNMTGVHTCAKIFNERYFCHIQW